VHVAVVCTWREERAAHRDRGAATPSLQEGPHHPCDAARFGYDPVDVKACARCGARLEVRAVVTDRDVARKLLNSIPRAARAPPPVDSTVAYEPAFA
jgi:hypothetical protein